MTVDHHERDDASLVRAAQAGDREAFAELFRRHHPGVRRVCARRMGSASEADDVAQAAFVRAFERIGQCGGERRFGPWVQVIALRLCADAWRARGRTAPLDQPLADLVPAPDDCEEALLRRERVANVREALAVLPSRQRNVVVARDLEGRRPGEIAAAFAISLAAVDSLLLRGRRRVALAYRALAAEQGAVSTSVSTAAVTATSAAVGVGPVGRAVRALGAGLDAAALHVATALGFGLPAPSVAHRVAGAALAGALAVGPLVAAPDTGRQGVVVPPAVAADPVTAPVLAAPARALTLAALPPAPPPPAAPAATSLPPVPAAPSAPSVAPVAAPPPPRDPGLPVVGGVVAGVAAAARAAATRVAAAAGDVLPPGPTGQGSRVPGALNDAARRLLDGVALPALAGAGGGPVGDGPAGAPDVPPPTQPSRLLP